jgi:hypothetical protein
MESFNLLALNNPLSGSITPLPRALCPFADFHNLAEKHLQLHMRRKSCLGASFSSAQHGVHL